MKEWIRDEWDNIFINPPTNGSRGKILVADVFRAWMMVMSMSMVSSLFLIEESP